MIPKLENKLTKPGQEQKTVKRQITVYETNRIENENGEYVKKTTTRKSDINRRPRMGLHRSEKIPYTEVVLSWPLNKSVY